MYDSGATYEQAIKLQTNVTTTYNNNTDIQNINNIRDELTML
jgi:hypothetical protein